MNPIDTEVETRLRRDLRARQDDVPPVPTDLADRVRRRHRSQRRTQALALVAAAAVVAVFAGASSLVGTPPTARTAETAEAAPPSTAPTILEQPTRGSLAADPDWLAGVRRLDWQIPTELFGELPDPPATERHVAFAGDVPGGRVALVVGEDDGQFGAAWFTGPAGAAPSDMQLAVTPQPVDPHAPLALWQSESLHARDGVLVVLAEPGQAVELTAPPVVTADGKETRDWVELPAVDGIVATRVEAAWALGRELRTRGASSVPYRVPVTLVHPGQADPRLSRPAADVPSDQALVDDLVTEVLADYDLTAEAARPTVLARGTAYQDERVLLVGLTFPSGATGAWLLTADQYGEGWSGGLDRLPHAPAGTALEDRLVAVPVDGYYLALHGPERAVRAEVLTEDARVLGSVELTDGAFVGEVPGGSFAPSTDGAASLRLLDATGAVVAEGPIGRLVAE